MNTEDWIYLMFGAFLWGVILGYWVRGLLPTAKDLERRFKP